jgi:dTDP-4-dehydrorhamnose reductase
MVAAPEGSSGDHQDAMTVRVLVTGADGQLGRPLVSTLATDPQMSVLGADRKRLDITDPASIAAVMTEFGPDVVVNCAAWTAVDAAEEDEAAATAVNGIAVGRLAQACADNGAWLVHLSTDYVFDGRARSPYPEDALPNPVSAYGRSKLAGEIAVQRELPDRHYIVRTAWLYGMYGQNFVRTILRALAQRGSVDVVDDQLGQPTYAPDLARQIQALIRRRPAAGIFHGTNSGMTSWYGFTRAIAEEAGIPDSAVRPTNSSAFPRPAIRPAYSVLGHGRWADVGIPQMRDWRSALVAAAGDGVLAVTH